LVYYTADDISQAKFVFLEKEDAFHPSLGVRAEIEQQGGRFPLDHKPSLTF